jgi:hypothetical protein
MKPVNPAAIYILVPFIVVLGLAIYFMTRPRHDRRRGSTDHFGPSDPGSGADA